MDIIYELYDGNIVGVVYYAPCVYDSIKIATFLGSNSCRKRVKL